MSLQRTALRLGAVGAILADPVLGAMLNGRVFDSRLTDFQSVEPVPVILLYTEDDEGSAFSSNGGPDFNRTCDLTMEIAIRALVDDGASVGVPVTDAEMEATLDLIEDRLIGSKDDPGNPGLFYSDSAFSAALRAHIVRKLLKVSSSRFTDDRTGDKYAVRVVTLACDMLTSGNENLAPSGLAAPLNLLPVSLQAIAAITPIPASIGATLAQIAGRLAAPAAPVPFTGVDMSLEVTAGDPVQSTNVDAFTLQFSSEQDQS